MAKLVWDKTGERFFELGVEKGVLYPASNGTYPKGVVWNGLTAVNESPSGAEPTALWADNMKYGTLLSNEEFGCTIEAYTYPDEFGACNGEAEMAPGVSVGQQKRNTFGFSYVTKIGNDVDGVDHGYKLHLVYGATAAPSEKSNSTINDSPEAQTMSWEITTTPIKVPGMKPAAHIVIDSTKVDEGKLTKLEEILYGKDGELPTGSEARLPLPEELATIFTRE